MFTIRFQAWIRRHAQRLAGLLAALPVTPNQVTFVGMLIAFAAAALTATGRLLPAGIVLAVGGTFDILDGALARVTGKGYAFGAFFDSTLDRFSEGAIYVGVAVYFARHQSSWQQWQVLGTALALAGSYLVSYVRARAQSLGFKCDVGVFARPERVVATVVGLVFGATVLTYVVWALAVLANFTVLQRVHAVWRQARAARREDERASVRAGERAGERHEEVTGVPPGPPAPSSSVRR
ncbi:MAG: CDP-alcohol phosphatidyltransferase family protein [Candidatus Dormibacterales bacterium]